MSEKWTVEKFLVIERGVETVRKKAGYAEKPNPIIEDFWALIEAYRAALIELDEYRSRDRKDA